MPEVSSIVKGDDDFRSIRGEPLSDGELWGRLADRIDTGALFPLSVEAKFPMIDIPQNYGAPSDRLAEYEKGKYNLGAGILCSVHTFALEHDVSPICSAGNIFALKHYTSRADEHSAKNLRKWLWNELRVFRHPYLQSQENLCKLHFIGWEKDNLIPLLGLEIAQYGTLADCLQDIRSYDTGLRKAHITLDIALGLTAIHSAKLVHGDVKPANIIVCAHHNEARKVIAKLSDFGGVSLSKNYDHEFGTALWEAPEVLLNQECIDWQIADVYSFGLVVATLWHSKGWIPTGASFIDPYIPFELKDSLKSRAIETLKLTPDHEPSSLLKLALNGTAEQDNLLLSLAQNVFRKSLPTLPGHRTTMLQLLKYFSLFAESTGRSLGSPPHPSEIDPSHWIDTSLDSSMVMNYRFLERTWEFQKTMFQAIQSKALELNSSVVIPPITDIEDNFDGDVHDLNERIVEENTRTLRNLASDAKLHELANCACNVAYCHLLGLGTVIDEQQAIHWFGIAALAGEGNSTLYYSPIEESIGIQRQVVLPRKLWCVYGLNAGAFANAPPLEDLDSDLYRRARYLRQNDYALAVIRRGRQTGEYLSRCMDRIRRGARSVDQEIRSSIDAGQRALHLCAAAGAMDNIKFLITEANADIDVLNSSHETPIFVSVRAGQHEVVQLLLDYGANVSLVDDEGTSILHVLSDMEDQYASEFVDNFVHRGALIDLVATQKPGRFYDPTAGQGTPLFWAALKSKKSLFKALLRCHAQPRFRIRVFDLIVLLRLLSVLHMHDLLTQVLEEWKKVVDTTSNTTTRPHDWQTKLNFDINIESIVIDATFPVVGHREYTDLLTLSSDRNQFASWARRCIHGRHSIQAKERTQRVLLDMDADPKSILLDVIQCNDITTFKRLILHLKTREVNVLSILSDPSLFLGYSALHHAIQRDARAIFRFLIDAYPDLIHLAGDKGRRPLQFAATQEWLEYTSELLERQASPHDRASDGSTALIWCLERNPNTSAAKEITRLISNNENTDIGDLLGPDPGSGFTAFANLLSGMLAYRTDTSMDRLEYFIEEFGKPGFMANVPDKTTVFDLVLHYRLRPLPSDEATKSLRLELIKLLLRHFPEKVNFVSQSGVTPLHRAVIAMDPAAVKLLIERGADINIQTENSDTFPVPGGLTCLDLAKWISEEPISERILKAGQREIAQFQTDIKEVARILIQNGAQGASQSNFNLKLWVAKMTGQRWAQMCHVTYDSSRGPHRNDRSKDGDWPKRLPREDGSEPHIGASGHTEYVDEDGISKLIPSETLWRRQLLFGAGDGNAHVNANYVKRKPNATKENVENLESGAEKRKEQRTIQARLPQDWDVNIAPGGRFYYRDHKNKTTTWDEPRQLR